MWILENCRNLKYFIYALLDISRALAKNCNETISEKGAEAKDWRGGKPLRVVRNCKGRKHSDYAPEEGNRYDGIYKVGGQFCFIHTHTGNLTDYWIVSLRSVWRWKGILEIYHLVPHEDIHVQYKNFCSFYERCLFCHFLLRQVFVFLLIMLRSFTRIRNLSACIYQIEKIVPRTLLIRWWSTGQRKESQGF